MRFLQHRAASRAGGPSVRAVGPDPACFASDLTPGNCFSLFRDRVRASVRPTISDAFEHGRVQTIALNPRSIRPDRLSDPRWLTLGTAFDLGSTQVQTKPRLPFRPHSPSPYPMNLFRHALVGCLLTAAVALTAADTAAFRGQLQTDLRRNIERHRGLAAAERASAVKATDFYYPYLLSGLVSLHAQTGESVLLTWIKEDVLGLTRLSRTATGRVLPFAGESFRFLPSFCDAYLYLKSRGALTPDEAAEVSAMLSASADARLGLADFGAQNRGLIRGAELLFCAHAVPDAPNVARWQRHGEALVYDSLNGWSVEDASFYGPFWLTYLLSLSEMRGELGERMKRITTRYGFDHTKTLLMPNGFLPDWGDGDWTHGWMFSVANLTLAGSHYRDGTYLEAARRLYEANRTFSKELSAEAIGGLGLTLRWLDPGVPLAPLGQDKSAEVVDDLVSKKIVFRGAAGAYLLLTYRDAGPFGRFTRDYQNAVLWAPEEKPHHGHADENSFPMLVQDGTVLLTDGGYRASRVHGYRADVFHNRIVARTGFPAESDMFDYLSADTTYHEVQTEKVHFGTFGSLDYARTRLVDDERGYTGDRITLFAPESGLAIVVDALLIDRPGSKVFCNTWHPGRLIEQGDNWVLAHPESIAVRTEAWTNPHTRELLIQFVGNRDKIARTREIDRRYHPSQVFYQYLENQFFKGQRLTFVTVLRPVAVGGFDRHVLDEVQLLTGEHDDGRTLGLRFPLGGETVTVGLKLDQTIGLTNLRGRPMFDAATGTVAYGALRTDADFAYVRERRDGGREFGFQYATAVSHAGTTLFQLPVWDRMWQGPGDFAVPDRRDKMPRWHEVTPAAAK